MRTAGDLRGAATIRFTILGLLLGAVPKGYGGLRWAAAVVLRSDSAPAAKSASYSRVSAERGKVSPEEYRKLRQRALENSQVKLSDKMRNPAVANNGLELAVVGALEEQRAYLKSMVQGGDGRQMQKKVTCTGAMIRMVNGKSRGVVFTPQPPDNMYRIEGCGFGEKPGEVRLELDPRAEAGATFRPLILQIKSSDSWSDDSIDVVLDSRLTSRLDASVTVAVYAASGRRMEFSGCSFVATRTEPRMLTTVPAAWVELQATTVHSKPISQLEYVSPSETAWGRGTSAAVLRSDVEAFEAGSDRFDFSQMNPGWVVESVQLQAYSASCPGEVTSSHVLGRWSLVWETKAFKVAWEDDVCTALLPQSLRFRLSVSEYAARVWVVGPVGTQPFAKEPVR